MCVRERMLLFLRKKIYDGSERERPMSSLIARSQLDLVLIPC